MSKLALFVVNKSLPISAALVSGILYRYIGFENILLLGTSLFFVALVIFALVKYQELDKVEATKQPGVLLLI